MRSDKNILAAFVLNLAFSLFELIGGFFTNSVAIMSDALHDIGDAVSIGVSYFLEKKSKRQPDEVYTYGYLRYSVMGSVITVLILLTGSVLVVINAVSRIVNPQPLHYDGMIVFAVIGVAVNFLAAFFTRHGDSLNQKAVNLHMLEDVLGWAVVLVGAIVMRFTDIKLIDPILSVCVAVYIFIHAFSHLKEALNLFLVKIPEGVDIDEIRHHLTEIDGVLDVHHIHVWSLDGIQNCATMHIVTDAEPLTVKKAVKAELREHGIAHATLELESEDEACADAHCHIQPNHGHHHHHHHHHH
ncbi:MAG: cation transporter [Oscillospiraceae bacterium]|nr:cation transporter [Oscillospiraceae bacterium]MBQ9929220.1 cation transporter [Oscillospiraceae bacterium]